MPVTAPVVVDQGAQEASPMVVDQGASTGGATPVVVEEAPTAPSIIVPNVQQIELLNDSEAAATLGGTDPTWEDISKPLPATLAELQAMGFSGARLA